MNAGNALSILVAGVVLVAVITTLWKRLHPPARFDWRAYARRSEQGEQPDGWGALP